MEKSDLLAFLEELAPRVLAEDWDNCGLLVDCGQTEYRRVAVALDATAETIDKACEFGADLLLTHHPIMLSGIKRIDGTTHEGQVILALIRNNISMLAMHTNLDGARQGVNAVLADTLGLVSKVSLQPARIPAKKLVVYVPQPDAEKVFEAMARAGAGHIGNYSHCSFRAAGTGTFLPGEGSSPYAGTVGTLERAEEIRLETIVRAKDLRQVVGAMLASHPYEEAAYDVYDLELEDDVPGLGLIGELPEAMSFMDFAHHVKTKLGAQAVRACGDRGRMVRKAAVSSGGGFTMFQAAAAAGADVFVTGDVRHHQALEAQHSGVCLIDAGHFETETLVVPRLIGCLQQRFDPVQYSVAFKDCGGLPPFEII